MEGGEEEWRWLCKCGKEGDREEEGGRGWGEMRKRKRRMASDVSHSSSEKWMVIGDEEEGELEEEKVESICMASRRAILFFFFFFRFHVNDRLVAGKTKRLTSARGCGKPVHEKRHYRY